MRFTKMHGIGNDYVYVDVGYKSEGKIPLNEFEAPPQIGENVYVILMRKEGKEGQVIVSKRRADEKLVWKNLRQAFDEHKPIEGLIDRRVKGGWEGVPEPRRSGGAAGH